MGAPISIASPTASGKSAVAMEVAKQLQAEIISVDSMQVYRGLDIGTAKPSAAEQAGISHHLIDCAGLEETYDAARFVREATAAERQIDRPIFCGGTGLYFQARQEGLGESPQADVVVRAAIEAMSYEEQLAELKAADSATFERIDQQNPRRVVRALEVIRLTGKPFSEQRAEWQNTVAANFLMNVNATICVPALRRGWMRCLRPGWWRKLVPCAQPWRTIASRNKPSDIDRLLGTSEANRTCRTPSRWLNPAHGNSHDDR